MPSSELSYFPVQENAEEVPVVTEPQIFHRQIILAIAAAIFVLAGMAGVNARAEEVYTPNEVYGRVIEIIDDLAEIRKVNTGIFLDQPIDLELLKNELQPRHVYQQALEVERRLNQLLRMAGKKLDRPGGLEFREHTPADVRQRVDKIFDGVGYLREINNLGARQKTPRKFKNKVPSNVYGVLGRASLFLEKLSAPAPQPPDVLIRAKTISNLLAMLCPAPDCVLPQYTTASNKRPTDVYIKAYELIHTVYKVTETMNWNIPGGIVAPRVSSDTVSPTAVNQVLGTLLADLIALHVALGTEGTLPRPQRDAEATPTNVWIEIDYANQIALALNASR